MINYIEKGAGLHDSIRDNGYSLVSSDGEWIASDNAGNKSVKIDAAVQLIIDTFDPLPDAQDKAKQLVKEASANQRLKFVTQAAGKDAEYTYKAQEAAQYTLDQTIGVFMQGRINATGETALAIAAQWNTNGNAWKQVGASIAGLEDKAMMLIKLANDWKQCAVIANSIIAEIERI